MSRKLPAMLIYGGACALALATVACSSDNGRSDLDQEVVNLTIELRSQAFTEGSSIPVRYTCDGEDVSPPLTWSGIPQGTQSIALIADDPDARAGRGCTG